jgi:hypothetical protein
MQNFKGLNTNAGIDEVRTRERSSICDLLNLQKYDPKIATRFIDSLGYAAERALGIDPEKEEFWRTPWLSSDLPPCGRVVKTILVCLRNDLSRDRSVEGKGKEKAEDPR